MNLRNRVLIKITLYSDYQNSIYIPSKRNESISILKKNLEKYSGISLANQILYYNGHPVHDAVCIEELIEPQNGVILNMNLDMAINGGAHNMEPIKAPDLTSEDCFEKVTFSTSAPFYRTITKGVNFEGICRNSKCIAHDELVCVRLNMCKESNNICNYNEYMFELQCPACKSYIETEDIVNVDFLDCIVKVKYKKVVDSRPIEYEMVAPPDEYLSLKEGQDMLKYNYIKFTLK